MGRRKRKAKRKSKWIQQVVEKAEKKGTKGAFRAKARRAGFKSTIAFARYVLSHKDKFSKKTILRANAALNMYKARKMK